MTTMTHQDQRNQASLARAHGRSSAEAVLLVESLRDAVVRDDKQALQTIMASVAQASDPKVIEQSSERAWRLVQTYLREGEELKANAVMLAMPDRTIEAGLGKLKDETLGLAARQHMHNAASTLINWDANPALRDFEGMTPLMHFASNGDSGMLEAGLRQLERRRAGGAKTAMELGDAQGWTVSMYAVVSGADDFDRQQVLAVAKRFGHEFNKPQGKDGFTEIHMAAGLGDSVMIKTLIDHYGASANAVSSNGLTPAMAAAYENEPAGLVMLWSKGADLNIRRVKDGFSAAHMAAVRGNHEVLNELHKCEANLRLPSFTDQQTPADMARFVNQGKTAQLIDQLQAPPPSPALQAMADRLNEVLAPVRRASRTLGFN